MIHLQKHIRNALQNEFDKNTKGIIFDVSLYNTKSNDMLTKEFDIENTYHTEQKRYVPVVIQDIFGEYVPIQNSTILQGNITSSLLIPVDNVDINELLIEDNVENVLAALDEIRMNNQGKSIQLGEIGAFINKSEISYEPSLINSVYIKGNLISNGVLFDFKVPLSYRLEKENNNLYIYRYDLQGQSILNSIHTLSKPLNEFIVYRANSVSGDNTIFAYGIIIEDGFIPNSVYPNGANYQIPTSSINDISTSSLELGNQLIYLEELRLFNFLEFYPPQSITILNFMDLEKTEVQIKDFITGENLLEKEIEYITLEEGFEKGNKGSMQIEFSVPNPSTNQFTYTNGINYQEFILEWGLTYSDNVFNGNDIKYYIDDIRIYPTHRSTGVTNTQNAQQKINANTSKSVNEDNILVKDYTMFYTNELKVRELVKHITDENLQQNKVWKLKEVYPTFVREHDVIIIDGGMSPTMNTPLSFSLELALADDILN